MSTIIPQFYVVTVLILNYSTVYKGFTVQAKVRTFVSFLPLNLVTKTVLLPFKAKQQP